ncbi:N-6 DNA methylase [Ferrimicrobium sp.]|uniref:HsdM family class I SAM-dependent methyltransferase n=1 Tax=Ferrimicrobium sp. TaxID=2926050 RepID=UPI002636C7EE|nr:N-6 DNA methylase [Ferrimicrobium sp.]
MPIPVLQGYFADSLLGSSTRCPAGSRMVMRTGKSLAERAHGMYFTPVEVATQLLSSFLDGCHLEVRQVLDLASGAGSFLVAADRILPNPLTLVGVEVDAQVAQRCEQEVTGSLRHGTSLRIIHGDGLDQDLNTQLSRQHGDFDLVLGNPPFLSPRLRSRRYEGVNGVDWMALRQTYSELSRATTDLSTYFVARAFDHLRVGGVCGMIVPLSFLSADGAASVRQLVEAQGEVLRVDRLPDDTFDASVSTVCVWVRRLRKEWGSSGTDAAAPGVVSWGSWVAESPAVDVSTRSRVKDVARTTAGFRDEFYQVATEVFEAQVDVDTDDGACAGSGDQRWYRVLTVGHLGWGAPQWGRRSVRIAGRRFLYPAVSKQATETMKKSLRGLLLPKLVIAPQKRVVTPWLDSHGSVMPLTPLISLVANDEREVGSELLAAAIGSPVAAAFLEHRRAGTALSPKALKFSARDLGEIPLPSMRDAWERAGQFWPSWMPGNLDPYLRAIRDAYQIDDEPWAGLLSWWFPRLGRPLS